MTRRHEPRDRPRLAARAKRTLAELRRERPELAGDDDLIPLQAGASYPGEDGPTLHLDDQSGIRVEGIAHDWSYLQDRARLRARDGDVVAMSHPPPEGYERYCQQYLGLGEVTWLTPAHTRYRTNLASHCWTDRNVRHELIHRLRTNELRRLHPLMGSRDPWQLARMLHRHAHRPLSVVAPPPALTVWINNKIAFANLVGRLFGEHWIPTTRSCSSLTLVTEHLRDLARYHRVLGVKLPDAAGGGGNIVIPATEIRTLSLHAVRSAIQTRLRAIGWRGERDLLVGAWETDVLSAPSAQLWIPGDGTPPIVEGVFEQIVERVEGQFVGCRTSELPPGIVNEIVDRCWLLGRLFQQLGYVGCCSFDLVVVGPRLSRSRLEFIECNGRWGGTSLPMLLVRRLLPPGTSRPYIVQTIDVRSDRRVGFEEVLAQLDDLLFDVRTGRGRVVVFNPLKLTLRSGLKLVAFGDTVAEAQQFVDGPLRARLASTFGDSPLASRPQS